MSTPSSGGGEIASAEPTSDACYPCGPSGYGGNFHGAGVSPARAIPEWSTLDTRFDITSTEQRELVRRSRALVANSGIARVLLTVSMLVGSQAPQMASDDAAWNDAVEALLRFENGSAMICDRAAQHNLEAVQQVMEFLAMRDGDCFVELTKTATGRAAFRLHEGHIVNGQPTTAYADRSWRHGIRYNRENRPTDYYFEEQDFTGILRGRVLPASDVIHYTYRDATGGRGVPALAHAIAHIIDIIERRGFTKVAIKLRAMLGIVIETDVDGKPMGQMPIVGQLRTAPGTSPAANLGKIASAADKGPKVEELTMTGNTAAIATLAPGQKATILKDDSPNPNAAEFENELLRDVATGLVMPPELIFSIAKQTGPMVRLTARMAEKRIAQRRAHMRNVFLNRWTAYQIACANNSKRLLGEDYQIPENWYACTWQEPASLTIDVGRDGNLDLKLWGAGAKTLSDVVGEAGGDWDENVKQKRKESLAIFKEAKGLMEDAAKEGLKVPFDQCLAMISTPPKSADEIVGKPEEKSKAAA